MPYAVFKLASAIVEEVFQLTFGRGLEQFSQFVVCKLGKIYLI